MASSNENLADSKKIKNYLSENLNDLAEVYAAHKNSLESCEEEINQWKKFIKDYNVLQEKLTMYPDKTSYEEVIPIGSLAYMKGRKIHTNEILVHLGENWFAERSVKDAIAIIARRKEVCKERLKSAERIKEIHEGWLKQTQALAEEGDKIEILEQLSEEEYEKSKVKHREMVAKHFALLNEDEQEEKTSHDEEVSIPDEIKNFEDLLRRLDALEEEERLQDELIESGEVCEDEEEEKKTDSHTTSKSGSRSSPSVKAEKDEGSVKERLQRRVSWADQLAERKQRQEEEDDDDEEEEEEDDEGKSHETMKIRYRTRQQSLPAELIASTWSGNETSPPEEQEEDKVEKEEEEEENQTTTPKSPSDLYKMFGPHSEIPLSSQPTKGILKKKGESFQSEETEKGVGWSDTAESITYIPSSPDEPILPRNPPLSESPKEIKNLKPAFSYKVVAREPEDEDSETTPTTPQASTPSSPPASTPNEEPKKISRFKASRMSKEK